MPTIGCKKVEKAVAADLKAYMFEITPAASAIISGTPDLVKDFKVTVKPGFENVIASITSATGTVKTSNFPTESAHTMTQKSVAAKNAVITKSAGIAETSSNAEGLWTVTFVLGITLNGGNTVSGYNVVLKLESPFNAVPLS